jgi:hypothetical protein
MTEPEWMGCEAPEAMVRHLVSKSSERKMRLFVVACCRRIWHSLNETEDRRAVELAERFADGEEGIRAVENFRKGIDWSRPGTAKYAVYPSAAGAAECVLFNVERSLVQEGTSAAVKRALREEGETAEEARQAGLRAYTESTPRVRRAARSLLSQILRDIFGNPFRPLNIDPAWLTTTVRTMAQTIYDDRRFEDLPILADAFTRRSGASLLLQVHCHQIAR